MHPVRTALHCARTVAVVAMAYATDPSRAYRATRAYYSVHPRKLPGELTAAVAEMATLHLPDAPLAFVSFPVYHDAKDGPSYGTDNVAFVRLDGQVDRLTLGGNPDWFGGLTPRQSEAGRRALEDSRDRVVAALGALNPTPDVRAVRVPLAA
jgi:hypothetical protein